MVPEEILVNTAGRYLDAGILGATCIFLLILLVLTVHLLLKAYRTIDELQKARLDDVREYAATAVEMKSTLQAATGVIQANTLALNQVAMRNRK